MKLWMWIGIGVGTLLAGAVIWIGGTAYWAKKANADYVWKFVTNNPEKAAITLRRDGQTIAQSNSDRVMPLASAVKTMIAIEYAKQAAAGTIHPEERVPLSVLDRYYLPNLDGGAHPAWLAYIEESSKAEGDAVTLEEVAKGMIRYSSNANTDYLQDKLGLERIHGTIAELGLRHHEPLFPLNGALLIPYELMKGYSGLDGNEAKAKAKEELFAMSADVFRAMAVQTSGKLKADADGSYKREANLRSWYDPEFDRFYSDRLTGSTTQEYASVMAKLNGRDHFTAEVHRYLDPVMEGLMENPANRELFRHAGRKGGSTAYVLTDAIYATAKDGTRIELALFFNGLNAVEMMKLSASLNAFELKLLTEPLYAETVGRKIGSGEARP
ncbi:serine hydrolase [Paenibacillus oceani]|uniref:Serine hydrolase n=1 Tax=Paenibacillus oceani TaxID=2772510 RepID=A0A927GYI2_9BACL|nr:serine hydrolase [Paenibacillus oceani]MBD2861062.1 serine hydrolase [Paenibacillus oceani]